MERRLPLIPVTLPLFPKTVEHVTLNAFAQDAMDAGHISEGSHCILAFPKELGGADITESTANMAHFHHIGVFAEVVQFNEKGDMEITALVETHGRVFISEVNHSDEGIMARCSPANSIALPKSQAKKAKTVLDMFEERLSVSGHLEDEVMMAVTAMERPSDMADQIAAYLELPATQRQQVLEELDVGKRLDLVVHLLNENIINASISRDLDIVLEDKMNRERKDTVLRAKLRAIQMELGEEGMDDAQEYEDTLQHTQMPDDTRAEIEKEIGKLRRAQPGSMEAGNIQAYLDFALSLPWNATTKKVKKTEIKKVQKLLDQRHYGLNTVKERMLEYLAVKRLAKHATSNILCLAGPPGVGKTSIVQSVAEALERPFYRISLGGVRDEADLRGHRRTYVGALPGKIIAAIFKSQANNPVILLDEIDKMASGFRGDPASVLLEVLDPEQNHSFMDHYLQIPYDLSNVLFICTANNLSDIPAPLLNRLELIRINGYSTQEKAELATKYMMPKLIREYGMEKFKIKATRETMEILIDRYTSDVGLRELRRISESLLRKIALRRVNKEDIPKHLNEAALSELLGPGIPKPSISKEPRTGRATALYTEGMVGNILPIEVIAYPGTGKEVATGNIDPLLKETIATAVSYLKKHQTQLGLPKNSFSDKDLHIHFHKTELEKRGEGWGLAIYTAILSALLDIKIPVNVAFAGQISLLGKVLPTSDMDLKLLSAAQLGIDTVIASAWNMEDTITVPPSIKAITVESLDEMPKVLKKL